MPRRAAPVAAFTHAPRAVVRAVLTGIPVAPTRGTRRHGAPVNRRRTPVRRQIAVATWRPSRDGRIYARMEVDVSAALAYLERVRAESGERVTLTHVVGAALGRALHDVPEIRARVVFGRLVPLETCDVGFAVDIGNGSDLAPVKVADVDRLSPLEVARAVDAGAARLRRGTDAAYRRTSRLVHLVPAWTMRPVMAASSLVSGGLGRGLVGQPGFPLGTAFVSNVGTLGLDEAFLAPLPFARTPVYLAVGRRAGPGGRRRRAGRGPPGARARRHRRPPRRRRRARRPDGDRRARARDPPGAPRPVRPLR